MIFAISLFCVMALPCCTMKIQKVLRRAKSSLDDFVCTFVVYYLFLCVESFVHSRTFWGLFTPFSPYGFIQQNQQRIAPIIELLKGVQGHMHQRFFIWVKNLFIYFIILGSHGGFFTSKTMFASIFPLSWAMGEGVFSWTKTLFNLAPSFPFFFLVLWKRAILTSSSNNSLKL